ncbi:hypothetical protein H0H92_015853, partial [Tricholoma furcatifolium]
MSASRPLREERRYYFCDCPRYCKRKKEVSKRTYYKHSKFRRAPLALHQRNNNGLITRSSEDPADEDSSQSDSEMQRNIEDSGSNRPPSPPTLPGFVPLDVNRTGEQDSEQFPSRRSPSPDPGSNAALRDPAAPLDPAALRDPPEDIDEEIDMEGTPLSDLGDIRIPQ